MGARPGGRRAQVQHHGQQEGAVGHSLLGLLRRGTLQVSQQQPGQGVPQRALAPLLACRHMAVSDRCDAQAPGRGFAQTMYRQRTDNVQQQQGRPQCVLTPLPAAICVLGNGLEACTTEPSFAQAGKLDAMLLIAEACYSRLRLRLLPLLYLPLVWA